MRAIERQREIYLKGLAGKKPAIPFNSEELREKARRLTAGKTWAYLDGGAGDERTMDNNRLAFNRLSIVPRMLKDNGTCDFTTSVLGTKLSSPFLLAPIGALDMIHRQGDLQVASACKHTGIPFVFSNQAGMPMEKCARAMGQTPYWFQLYWSRSDELVFSLVRRAEDAGCAAIVLTVDTTMLGWRSRDLSLGYLPFLQGLGIAQYTSDPVFQRLVREARQEAGAMEARPALSPALIRNLLRLKRRYSGSLRDGLAAVRLFTQIYTNPSLDWERLRRLKSFTSLPVFIKGILHADDASQAREAGADGIIVSNHGGRQVDGAIAALEALAPIRRVLPKPFPLLFDSGIRTGSDAFKAIASGADAVLIGRPYTYGLSIAGERGVESVLLNLLSDFELTARLSGCRNIKEIGSSTVLEIG